MTGVLAMVFDVFVTTVDWRGGVTCEADPFLLGVFRQRIGTLIGAEVTL